MNGCARDEPRHSSHEAFRGASDNMKLRFHQALLLLAVFATWYGLTESEILPPFFFGRPLVVLEKAWEWFASGKIYEHLAVTLIETVLAFVIGTLLALVV